MSSTLKMQPMYVQVKRGSAASRYYAASAKSAVIKGSRKTDLKNFGGKTLPKMIYKNYYLGGTSAWKESDIDAIEKATIQVMRHKQLNTVLAQYFDHQALFCDALEAEILATPKPVEVTQGDIEKFTKDLFLAGQIKDSDLAVTIFNFILPRGSVLNTKQKLTNNLTNEEQTIPGKIRRAASSLDGLGGYHSSVHAKRTGGSEATIYYSVDVFSDKLANGQENGIVAFDDAWKNVVATLHHELNEFRTDPDVGDSIREDNADFLGWMADDGNEIGDFPLLHADPVTEVIKEIKLTGKKFSLPFQMLYSNTIHGAENPFKVR